MILNLGKLKKAGFHIEHQSEDIIEIHGDYNPELGDAYAEVAKQLTKGGLSERESTDLLETLASKAETIQIINICSQ